MTRGHVQPHERFACSGHARHKHDRLPSPGLRIGDDPLDALARGGEVHGPGVAAGDVVHRVAGVERPGRLDDRGRGGIGARAPGGGVQKGASHHFRGVWRRGCITRENGGRHLFVGVFQGQADRAAE